MADDKKTEEEPSIEEILSSIRDIISEDDEAEATEEAQVAVASDDDSNQNPVINQVADDSESNPEEEDDDILELTDLADEEDVVSVLAEENNDPLAGINLDHPDDDDLDVDDGLDDILGGDGDKPKETSGAIEEDVETAMSETTEIQMDDNTDDALVDKIAESATVGAMVKLAENIAISRTKEGTTLEDIVKESLRPMLKVWLDENLPTIIERLVSKELERLANKAAGK